MCWIMVEVKKETLTFHPRPGLRKEFYGTLGRKYGIIKGKVSECLNEAMELWLQKEREESP